MILFRFFTPGLPVVKQFFRSHSGIEWNMVEIQHCELNMDLKYLCPILKRFSTRAGKTKINVSLSIFSMHMCCVFTYIWTKHVLRLNCHVSQIICQDAKYMWIINACYKNVHLTIISLSVSVANFNGMIKFLIFYIY